MERLDKRRRAEGGKDPGGAGEGQRDGALRS